jgi:Sulfotransferase family
MLPNLIVIGAERCGTTTLHRYVGSHPQVFMSRQKELDFFVAEQNWARGRRWYERKFPVAPIRGESSPSFTGVAGSSPVLPVWRLEVWPLPATPCAL